METVPRKAVVAVAFIMVALAGIGAYQGFHRSSAAEPESGEAGLPSLTSPVAGAKNASALTEPLAPNLTEAQIRDIARQEVRAALTKPASTPASSEGDDQAPIGGGKPLVAPAAPLKPPALQTPVAPTNAPSGDANQAPLF
jgi:hypothetical protein